MKLHYNNGPIPTTAIINLTGFWIHLIMYSNPRQKELTIILQVFNLRNFNKVILLGTTYIKVKFDLIIWYFIFLFPRCPLLHLKNVLI